jgi:hypothetical protein
VTWVWIELAALRGRKPSPPSGTGDPIVKKGKKKTQQTQQQGPSVLNQGDLQRLLDGLDRGLIVLALRYRFSHTRVPGDMPRVASRSILASFQRLQWLSESESLSINNHSQIAALHGVVISALSSLSGLLQPVLSTPGLRQPLQVLKATEILLDHLLGTTIELIAVLFKRFAKGRGKSKTLMAELCTAFDEMLGSLCELILLPIVRAVWPLCQTYTAATFGKGKEKTYDVRMGLLAVLRKSLCTMEKLREVDPGITFQLQSLLDRIALEGIRELMVVCTTMSISRRDDVGNRVKRLARKDAVRALCDALHVAFGGGTTDQVGIDGGTARTLLKDEMLERMGELVRGMTSVSEVERNMVLGVVERGWVGVLGSCIW